MKFIDSLYGEIELEIPHEVLVSPELQRLREVRLCNVNSPFIPGGGNLNRFEHAVGTAFLAQEFAKVNELKQYDKDIFILAAILHDVVTAPFGHSFEYLLEALKDKTYQHADVRKMIFSGRTVPYSRNFFVNKKATLSSILRQNILDSITDILEGRHPLSKFMSNVIDIDNIDNVFRFAYHIGIIFDKKYPLSLAKSLYYDNDDIILKPETIIFFEEWFRIRSILYKNLLENNGEFIGKALLERCLIECVKDDIISEVDWILTDNDLINLVLSKGNKIAKQCIQRLMLMDFPQKYEIMYTNEYKKLDDILSKTKVSMIDDIFKEGVFLHFIRDVNKTKRIIKGIFHSPEGNLSRTIGLSEDRYLIGIFSDSHSALIKAKSFINDKLQVSFKRVSTEEANGRQKSIFAN